MRIKRPLMLSCILVIIVCISYHYIHTNRALSETLPEEAVSLQGRIDMWETGNGQTILYLSDVILYGDSAEETTTNRLTEVRCYIEGMYSFKLGQSVAVQGFLELPEGTSNPGGFDAALYYETKGYPYVLYDGQLLAQGTKYDLILQGLDWVRRYADGQLEQYLVPEDAGILSAMLLGDKSDMTAETKELYREVGIYHILSISGLHISMIGGFIYGILKRFPMRRWKAAMISLVVILAYGVMIDMPPSAFRAIVMFGFGVVAPLCRRSHDKLTSMAFAAACLAVCQPLLMFDAGVQLSFLAVLGIVALYPTFLGIHRHHMAVADGLWVSFAVTYMTLPIIMNTYYQVPLYSLLVNVYIVPLVPILLGLGLVIVVLGGMWSFPAVAAGMVIHWILLFYKKILGFVGGLPGNTYITGTPEKGSIILFYVVLTVMIYFILKIKRKLLIRSLLSENAYTEGRQQEYAKEQRYIKKVMVKIRIVQTVIMSFLLVILLWHEPFDCRITFLDVGQGDGICVETGEEVYMIDCGSSDIENLGRYTVLPYMKCRGISKVDGWVLTHPDNDHTSAFKELCEGGNMDGLKIETLYIPEALQDEFKEIAGLAERRGIQVVGLSQGDILTADRIKWTVLWPAEEATVSDVNAFSLVLYLECNEFRGLFMGDAGNEAEESILMHDIRDITLLKVGHHGSAVDANGDEFIMRLNPEMAVISCSKYNVYGHPHPQTLERLNDAGSMTWVTAGKGAVSIVIKDEIKVEGYMSR